MKYTVEVIDFKLLSVNRKFFTYRNRMIMSKDYRDFYNNLEKIFNESEKPSEPIEHPCKTRIEVWTYNDIDNIVKPIHDILEKTGYIKNDRLINQTLIIKTPVKRGELSTLRVELSEIK